MVPRLGSSGEAEESACRTYDRRPGGAEGLRLKCPGGLRRPGVPLQESAETICWVAESSADRA